MTDLSTLRKLTESERRRYNELDKFAMFRFDKYVRNGVTPKRALIYAEAFARNMAEQKERRRSHDTGVEI
jgi:hypothetical protein